MKRIIYLIISLLLSNIAIAGNTANANGLTLTVNHFAILPQNLAPQLLKQCSRDTPLADSFWIPEQAQIIQLEEQIIDFMNQKTLFNTPISQAYDRQYIGIIQNGKRFIYGNYFPSKHTKNRLLNLSQVVNTCDGFGRFWGIVYDPETQQFSQLKINGLSDTP